MKCKKLIALLLAVVLCISSLAACNKEKAKEDEPTTTTAENKEKEDEKETDPEPTDNTEPAEEDEIVDLEVWYTNIGSLGIEKDGPAYNFYKDLLGVGITQPYVEWNGGETYLEQLNLRISGGDMPDMFLPVQGIETELIENGALLDLSEYLPTMAPDLWKAVPEDVWDTIRTYDPTGNGGIYVVPTVVNFAREGGLIRQDWLDALGLAMPTTIEEFENVLRAFKTEDPNGNGQADELPTGGRAEARWMDHLFAFYGIAMYEGFPEWDIYDGELTYSAVTQNMKDCLQWLSKLYAEGLIDPESMLNDKAAWEGKIASNEVGVYYHWVNRQYEKVQTMYDGCGATSDYSYLPCISAEGYEGYYTIKSLGSNWMCCKNTDDMKKIEAYMKVLNCVADPDLFEALTYGPEGYLWERDENGNRVALSGEHENLFINPINVIASVDHDLQNLEDNKGAQPEYLQPAYDRAMENLKAAEGKLIAGDGMPSSIYDGNEDIQARTLYIEYASKIIIGEWDIDKFDEFVEKWYELGGQEVTDKAREWYATKAGK